MSTNGERIADPGRYYHHPTEVKSDNRLSVTEKITLLQNWRDDEKLRSIATNENMLAANGADNCRLDDIEKLLAFYEKLDN